MRIRQLLIRLIALSIGLLIALLAGEIVIRMYWYGTDGFSYTRLNSFKSLGVSGFIEASDDHRILYEVIPNLDTLFKLEGFKTNSLGMRDKEYEKKKDSSVIRVAVIGDSFAMGSGVAEEESYPRQLEKLLNNQEIKRKVEVLNFATGGYNLLNYQGVLEKKALQFNPDLVLIGFCGGNDFKRPHPKHLEGDYKVKPVREMFYVSYLRKFIKSQFKKRKRNINITPNESECKYVDSSFAVLSSICIQNNLPLVVAYHSLLAKETDVDLIKKQALKNKIPFVNASEKMINKDPKVYFDHKLDHHPNAQAHKIFAETITDYLIGSTFIAKSDLNK